MILFFDEDCGSGVAKALGLVGYTTKYVGARSGPSKGTPDEVWLEIAGQEGWLVISCNKAILRNEAQRRVLVDNRVGIVFISTGNETNQQVLYLLLRKMKWLEQVHRETERPFAFTLSVSGHITRVDLSEYPERP